MNKSIKIYIKEKWYGYIERRKWRKQHLALLNLNHKIITDEEVDEFDPCLNYPVYFYLTQEERAYAAQLVMFMRHRVHLYTMGLDYDQD